MRLRPSLPRSSVEVDSLNTAVSFPNSSCTFLTICSVKERWLGVDVRRQLLSSVSSAAAVEKTERSQAENRWPPDLLLVAHWPPDLLSSYWSSRWSYDPSRLHITPRLCILGNLKQNKGWRRKSWGLHVPACTAAQPKQLPPPHGLWGPRWEGLLLSHRWVFEARLHFEPFRNGFPLELPTSHCNMSFNNQWKR